MRPLAVLVLSFAMPLLNACTTGASEARRDIANGHLELRTYGLPPNSTFIYEQLLQERLGVTYNRVAGCMVTDQLVRDADAYNEVMTKEIEDRFGKGILDQIFEEAGAISVKQRGGRPSS